MSRETIGERIQQLRLERGLSLRDLEQPGISSSYLSRIETGSRTPSEKALRLLAGRLCTTALQLETGDPDGPCPHCGREQASQCDRSRAWRQRVGAILCSDVADPIGSARLRQTSPHQAS